MDTCSYVLSNTQKEALKTMGVSPVDLVGSASTSVLPAETALVPIVRRSNMDTRLFLIMYDLGQH
jgi:hypothetical protein